MSSIRFCPFCREAYEGEESCPEHGLRLVDFQALPKPQRLPLMTTLLPAWEFRYARGWVMAGALLDFCAFALPLAELRGGITASSTLYALASGRAKTLWLVPIAACAQLLVLARRRSIADMLGARLSILWIAALQFAVVAITLLGVFDAVRLMNERAREPVEVTIGLGTFMVVLATAASLWGGFRLGHVQTPPHTRVETLE